MQICKTAQKIFNQTVDDLSSKLKSAIGQAGEAEDDYYLTVNLRRMYQLQLAIHVSNESLCADMLDLLDDFNNLDVEVVRLIFLNMYLHITWSSSAIDHDNPDESAVASLLATRARLIQHLYSFVDFVLDSWDQGNPRNVLTCTMCLILSDIWSLFSEAKLAPTKLRALGFCPPMDVLERFWQLCEYRLTYSGVPWARDTVTLCATWEDYISETVKQLLAKVKQQLHADDLSGLYLNAMKRAYQRHMDEVSGSDDDLSKSPSFTACKDLAVRFSSSCLSMARAKYRSSIMEIVKGGIEYAFHDAPKELSFLEGGVIQFVLKLPAADIREM